MSEWIEEIETLERICNECNCSECKLGYCIKPQNLVEESKQK